MTTQSVFTTNQTNPLYQFQQFAVAEKLSANAILLWQQLYFMTARDGMLQRKSMVISTSTLMEALQITRSGLQKVRRALVEAGLLRVSIDFKQQVWYTLQLPGTNEHDATPENNEKCEHKETRQVRMPSKKANAYVSDAQYPGDILHNDVYRKLVNDFCGKLDEQPANDLNIALQQFFYKRKETGKTLTKGGLDAMLNKLLHLAKENITTMIAVVEQSMQRGWSGFYPYRNQTQKQTKRQSVQTRKNSKIAYYDTQIVDLDFLMI